MSIKWTDKEVDLMKKTSERTVCGAINIPNGSIKEIYILKRAK